MFQIGDKVIYKSFGVCTVTQTDATMEGITDADGNPRLYYVLKSQCARGGEAFVPADRANLMRKIITHDEALTLLEKLGDLEPDTFLDKNMHTMEAHFKEILAQHDCLEAMRVALTMDLRLQEQARNDHKPSALYTKMLDAARTQVREEVAAALDITEEEAETRLNKAARLAM